MNILKHEFEDQKQVIDKYFIYLKSCELQNSIPIEVTTIQKSSCILILYNLIESTMTKVLEKIHINVINGSFDFKQLNENLRKTIFIYYSKMISEDRLHSYFLEIEKFIYILSNLEKVDINYKKLSELYPLYSGNLDSKEIRSILNNKYGFNLLEHQLKETALQGIKTGRNKLAHGEESFEEYGRTLSIDEIVDKKDKVFEFLEKLLDEVEDYITNKKFLA